MSINEPTTVYFQTIPLLGRNFMLLESINGTVLATGWDTTALDLVQRAKLQPQVKVQTVHESTKATQAVTQFGANDYTALDDVVVDQPGTELQRAVWQHLRTIPAGTTQTYTEVAKAVGSPAAIRAVASACGKNANALFVPCHRVVAQSGALAGFAWGLDVKEELLRHEGALESRAGHTVCV